MARVFIDGFESGGLGLWDTIGGTAAVNNSLSGRDGNYCLDCLGAGSGQKYLIKTIASKSALYVAFRFYPSNSNRFFTFYNGTTKLGYVNLTALGGNVRAYRGDTLLATGTVTVNGSTWHLIEIHYIPATSGGVFQVKVNGISDISYSGSTTPGATTIDRIMVGHDDSAWPPGYYDNVILDDADWIGDTKIQAIKPTAAGNSTQWDPSSGSNWDCVDEIPANDNDYVSTNSNDALDLYTFSDLTGSIEEVKCVQLQARTIRNGAATPQNLQLAVRSGGTNYFSSSMAVPYVNPKSFSTIWQLNPNTSAAWSVSEVNAADFGMKAVA
jgi:hypothetical protein